MRRRFHRHPAVFWLAAAVLALLAYSSVSRATARGHRFDPVVRVLVVRRAVRAGGAIGRDDVAAVDVPARFVPVGGLRAGQGAVGRTALVDLVPGEVVVARRLAGLDVQGVAALVPAGRRAVVVPVGEAGVVAHPGDRVDVLATFEADPASGDPTVAVARAALVLDVREGAVTLAVATAEAPRLAFALARGTVTLALVPR